MRRDDRPPSMSRIFRPRAIRPRRPRSQSKILIVRRHILRQIDSREPRQYPIVRVLRHAGPTVARR